MPILGHRKNQSDELPMILFAQRTLLFLAIAALAVMLFYPAFDRRQATEFRLDNRSGKYDIRQLTVAGDFNDWSTNRHRLRDENNEGVWEVTIPLKPGGYHYRFVLNGEHWLRDYTNPQYSGEHSNAFIYVDTIAYPQVLRVRPANGSWLYEVADSAVFHFDQTIEQQQVYRISLIFDGLEPSFSVRDSTLRMALPVLSEGEHTWRMALINSRSDTVYVKQGLWYVNFHNQAPRAHAGNTQWAYLGQKIELNGGRTYDPDWDGPLRFRWQMISGPSGFTLQNIHTPFPEFSATAAGTYRLRMTVRDSLGATAADETEVLVLNAQQPQTLFTFDPAALTDSIQTISLVGEFNQWNAQSHSMQWDGDSRNWQIALPLDPGQYEYKFVVNGSNWIIDPQNPHKIEDGWQGFNSIKTVAAERLFELALAVDSVRERGNEFEIPLRISQPAGARLFGYADIKNPRPGIRYDNRSVRFNKSNPPGHYYFYCFLEKDGFYSRPAVLLINHFTTTTFVDFNASPSWPDSSVVYEIFVRRYTPQGTIPALTERLPHLKDLGVDVLWLMPVYEGPTDHGYGPTLFFNIEQDYGTLEDYRLLIRRAHQLGMKVVFDFVANHTSDQHRFFHAALDNTASPLRFWYHWNEDGTWQFHNDWDTLVNLNFDNPQVRYFILEMARFWLGLGVDGFRCDVAWAVPHSFWKDFRRVIKELNPQCLLINEVLPRQQIFHDMAFDMSYDTDFYGNMLDVLQQRKSLSALDYGIKKTRFNYPPSARDLRYLENHDLPRFIRMFGPSKTRLMAALLFTVPGTPLIYYGQELGLTEMRPDYPWEVDSKWFDFYHSLIKLRLNKPSLTGGEMLTMHLDDDQRVWHFRRVLEDDHCDVFINLSTTRQKINVLSNLSTIYLGEENLKRIDDVYYLEKESYIIGELEE